MSADWISPTADARWHTSVYIWYNVECKPTAAVNSGLSQQQSCSLSHFSFFVLSCQPFLDYWSCCGSFLHFTTVCFSCFHRTCRSPGLRVADGGRRWPSPCLWAWLSSFLPSFQPPPLLTPGNVFFQLSLQCTLFRLALQQQRQNRKKKKKIPPLLVTTEFTSFVSHQWHPCLSRMHISVRTAMLHTLLFHIWDTFLTEIWI